MVTRDGLAKVLDFGLAKLVEPHRPHAMDGSQPTMAATAALPDESAPGLILGTIGYMSPEQAEGKTQQIDHRSDVFSFGCILYEVATGQRPFDADSRIKSLHKVVYEPAPPIKDLNPAAPPDLQRIIRRCLAKDPEERYQSIKDLAIELKELRRELDATAHAAAAAPPSDADHDAATSGAASKYMTGSAVGPRTSSTTARYPVPSTSSRKSRATSGEQLSSFV